MPFGGHKSRSKGWQEGAGGKMQLTRVQEGAAGHKEDDARSGASGASGRNWPQPQALRDGAPPCLSPPRPCHSDERQLLMRTAHTAEVHPRQLQEILIFGGVAVWQDGRASTSGRVWRAKAEAGCRLLLRH